MGVLENKFQDNVVVASMDKLLGWARSTSPWYFQFGLACGAIEMMASAASRHDLERIGMMPRSSPRQADVMIVAGTVTMKMALRVKKLYEQMADPKICDFNGKLRYKWWSLLATWISCIKGC